MLSRARKFTAIVRGVSISPQPAMSAMFFSTSGSADGEGNIRAQSSILKDMYEKASAKKTEELLEKQQGEQQNPEDEGIHPDWLAMERRVKFKKPRPKSSK